MRRDCIASTARKLLEDRPGTTPCMTWSPGLWSLLACQSPKNHMVLAGQMGSGPTASLGKREAIVLVRDSRLSAGRLIRCRSSPWGWFSSRGGSCSDVGEIHTDSYESYIPASRHQYRLIHLGAHSWKIWVASFLPSLVMTERPSFCFSESLFWFSV